jgi:adenylate cyclase
MSSDQQSAPLHSGHIERRLAAILSADVKGYSRLMGEDEVATIRTLTAYRAVMTVLIQQHHGRVVDAPGDNLLAEFASIVNAVQCAVTIQHDLKAHNAAAPSQRRMEFRIGINLGDVVVEGERIYGDGVNIAARVEGLAEPGGICLSGNAYEQVRHKVGLHYEDLGEQAVKNIAEPVRVWQVAMDEAAAALAEQTALQQAQPEQREAAPIVGAEQALPATRQLSTTHRNWMVAAIVIVSLLLIAIIVAARYFSFSVPNTQPLTPHTQPSLSTQDSALRTDAAPAALPLPDKPSIVILPFDNMSKDPQQDYFSTGLTEVLTSDLSRISSLFVIARNTAFTYKGKATNVQEIGKELGVRYVLEGSVQRASDQVRIVAQLIDATTGGHLWTERFDRPFTDIFALQDEIVRKIATTLKLQLTLQEQGYIVRKHTNNLEAYDSFLRGVEYFWRLTKEDNAQARQMWEQALALDPQYAEAYAWLGWTYLLERVFRWSTDPQILERALALVQKALTLDDSLAVAHSRLGRVYTYKQQYDQALAEGERAIALDPNDADSYAWQAEALNFAGRPKEALRMVEQAMRLNPRYPPFYLFHFGWASQSTGRYAEAVAAQKEVISRNPNFLGAHLNLAFSYLAQWASQQDSDTQTLAQALAAAQRAISLSDSHPLSHVVLGYVYLWQKQYEPATAEMERAIALDPNGAGSYVTLAETLSRVGRLEEAVAMAEQALRHKPFTADEHLSSVGAAYYLARQPEEAIAPLKQYLSHYPNILSAHLTLTAVYSELGREAEARAEAAEVLRINPQFSLEVHKERTPIKDPAMLERHIEALRKAGLK